MWLIGDDISRIFVVRFTLQSRRQHVVGVERVEFDVIVVLRRVKNKKTIFNLHSLLAYSDYLKSEYRIYSWGRPCIRRQTISRPVNSWTGQFAQNVTKLILNNWI